MDRTRTIVRWSLVPLGAIVSLLAAAPWLRAFPAATFVPLAVVSVVLASAIPVVTASVLRRGLWWSAPASVVVLLVVLLGAVLRDPFALGDLGRGIGQGPARLLSTTLPITTSRWVLVVPVIVVWATAAALAELLVRSHARGTLFAVAFASFGVAYALTAGGEGDLIVASALLLGATATLVCLRAWLERPRVPVTDGDTSVAAVAARPLRAGAAIAVVLGLVLWAVADRTDVVGGAPVVPEREPGTDQSLVVTPLATFASLRRGDLGIDQSTVLLRVSTDQPTSGYLTAAHVDDYDGDAWRFARTFEPTGGRIPGAEGRAGDTVVEQRYEVADLGRVPGGWMAFVDRPVEVSGVEVRYDPGTAMLVPVDPLDRGTTYQVRSRAPATSLDQLGSDAEAVIAASPDPQDTQLPVELRAILTIWVERIEAQAGVPSGGTVEFLAAAQQALRTRYARVEEHPAPSTTPGSTSEGPRVGGTTFADVAAAIGNAGSGTPEQFATLYALVARRLGVPARVVSGFRLTRDDRGLPASPDGRDVTAADAWTWVEVPVVGQGWVVVDPTPSTTTEQPSETGSASSVTTTTAVERAQTDAVSGAGGTPIAPPGDLTVPEGPGRPRWPLLIVVGALVLLLLIPLLASLQRLWYRRRRRRGPPVRRAIGAWHDTLETLERSGVRDLDTATNTEVVDRAGSLDERVREPVTVVAATANTALFSPAGVDEVAADVAWASAREVRSAARRGRGWRRRVRGWFSVSRAPSGDRSPGG